MVYGVQRCAPTAHARTQPRDVHVKLECRIEKLIHCCEKKRPQHCRSEPVRVITFTSAFDSQTVKQNGSTRHVPSESLTSRSTVALSTRFCADEDGEGQKVLALTIKKRRDAKDRTAWWSGVLEGDDKW